MKFTLKQRFWLWVYRWSKRLFYYADEKSSTTLGTVLQSNIGSSSNDTSFYYVWDRIWDKDDDSLYSLDDGEPVNFGSE